MVSKRYEQIRTRETFRISIRTFTRRRVARSEERSSGHDTQCRLLGRSDRTTKHADTRVPVDFLPDFHWRFHRRFRYGTREKKKRRRRTIASVRSARAQLRPPQNSETRSTNPSRRNFSYRPTPDFPLTALSLYRVSRTIPWNSEMFSLRNLPDTTVNNAHGTTWRSARSRLMSETSVHRTFRTGPWPYACRWASRRVPRSRTAERQPQRTRRAELSYFLYARQRPRTSAELECAWCTRRPRDLCIDILLLSEYAEKSNGK